MLNRCRSRHRNPLHRGPHRLHRGPHRLVLDCMLLLPQGMQYTPLPRAHTACQTTAQSAGRHPGWRRMPFSHQPNEPLLMPANCIVTTLRAARLDPPHTIPAAFYSQAWLPTPRAASRPPLQTRTPCRRPSWRVTPPPSRCTLSGASPRLLHCTAPGCAWRLLQ
jgi:hypothetical protein